jgi:hypothetical protein
MADNIFEDNGFRGLANLAVVIADYPASLCQRFK